VARVSACVSGKQSGRALPAFSCYFSCSQTYWKDASGIPLDLRVLLWEPLREPPRLAMAPASGGAPPEGTLLGQYEQPAEPADGHVRPPAPAASSMLGSWRGGLEVLAWPSADRSGGSGDDWPTPERSREPRASLRSHGVQAGSDRARLSGVLVQVGDSSLDCGGPGSTDRMRLACKRPGVRVP
jgi:hypothetical protein